MEKIHEFAQISKVQTIMNGWAKTTGLGAVLLETDGAQICVTPGASTSATTGLAHASEDIAIKNVKVGSVFVSAILGGESNVDFDSAVELLVNTLVTVIDLEYDKKASDDQKDRLATGIAQCEKLVGVIQDKTKSLNSIQGRQNILALNASIEAARAGDAGKGFAVVAKEVGSLSQQSKGLNEEISKTILDISKAVHSMTSGEDAQ